MSATGTTAFTETGMYIQSGFLGGKIPIGSGAHRKGVGEYLCFSAGDVVETSKTMGEHVVVHCTTPDEKMSVSVHCVDGDEKLSTSALSSVSFTRCNRVAPRFGAFRR